MIASLTLELRIEHAQSLKGKCKVVRSLKEKTQCVVKHLRRRIRAEQSLDQTRRLWSHRIRGSRRRQAPDATMPGILSNPGHMDFAQRAPSPLEGGNVLRLPALRAFGHVELHGLAFLQALKAARLDCGEMHENVFAILTADETIAFGVVKPLHCSLFCH